MKKKLLTLVLTLALVVTAIGVVGCAPTKPKRASAKEVYAMSAISSASYLTNGSGVQGASAQLDNGFFAFVMNADVAGQAATARPVELDNDIKQINDYVNMFKGYLLKGGVDQTSSKPTAEADGEYASYKIKLQVSMPTADGKQESYTMYYNEVATETNTEIEEDVEEVETSTTLAGVLVVGKEVFDVTGERNVETEGTGADAETETEIIFTTKSKTNPENFIVVTQEIELGEVEYEYAVHNGANVSKTQVEWESEDGEDEMSITFKNTDGTVKNKTKYSLDKKVIDGKDVFEVKFTVNEKKSTFKVFPSETANKYVYENGFEETL